LNVDLRQRRSDNEPYPVGPSIGAFSWRDRYSNPNLETRMLHKAQASEGEWPPVAAGLFGGSPERAVTALRVFIEIAAGFRHRRY
jgi:hypothetical protein